MESVTSLSSPVGTGPDETNARQNRLQQAIDRGLAYLSQHQYPNGEFCCYIAADAPMQGWCVPDSAVFPTALIATSLLALAGRPEVETMLNRTIPFLQYQMLWGGVWHHFTHLHPLRTASPADADDTVYVSSLLRARNAHYPYAQNVPVLLANRNRAGLFYTWFILRLRWQSNWRYWRVALREIKRPLKTLGFWPSGEAARGDVDAVVNANVLYYLGEQEATQPIIDHLLRVIAEGREADCDKWYRDSCVVYYFLSRNYYAGVTQLEPARQPVIDRILATAQADGRLGESVLSTALNVCTLLNWRSTSPELIRAIDFLLDTQPVTGEWLRWLAYYGGPKRLQGWGSEELTTGFCLEALARYGQQITNELQ